MSNTYKYNDTTQLTDHFNVQEFRCKCGGTHNITVNTELLEKAEKLMGVLGAEHIYISSANRCKQHDINVGGSGWGMHTVGKALDFALTKDGKYIDSRVIACVAQELGFTGIGRITGTYIHCDVGTLAEHGGKKWLGDETVSGGTSGSVINEPDTYWRYYGINRSDYIHDNEESAEKRLQESLNALGENLDVDGIIGEKTLSALKKHPVSKGDTGDYIKAVQEILNSRGYDCGTADGIAGSKTVSAICSAAWDRIFT